MVSEVDHLTSGIYGRGILKIVLRISGEMGKVGDASAITTLVVEVPIKQQDIRDVKLIGG